MACALTPEAVLAEVEAVMSRPFVWGACDCVSAACDVFLRLWGLDPLSPWRGLESRAAVVRAIRAEGGTDAALMRLTAGLRPGHAIGGLAVTATAPRSLLICIQPGLWAGKTIRGFALLRAAERGWHA